MLQTVNPIKIKIENKNVANQRYDVPPTVRPQLDEAAAQRADDCRATRAGHWPEQPCQSNICACRFPIRHDFRRGKTRIGGAFLFNLPAGLSFETASVLAKANDTRAF